MIWKSKRLKTLIKPYNQALVFLLPLSLFLFVSNNKTYLLIYVLYTLFLFFLLKKDLWETILLTFFLSLPFENYLRQWIFEIVSPLIANTPITGYNLYFGISVKLILGLLIFLLILLTPKKISFKRNRKETILLLFFLLLACLNTLFTTHGITPLLGLIRIWLAVLIFILSGNYFSQKRQLFFNFIISLYIFSITIGVIQLFIQKPTGRFIELTSGYHQQEGYQTVDGDKQYRISGFISHPVYFASFISILFPIIIGFYLNKIGQKTTLKNIAVFCFITLIGCTVILGTLSRSSFLTLILTLWLFRKHIEQKILIRLVPYLKKYQILKYISIVSIIVILAVFIRFLTPRIKSFSLLFTQHGNGLIRLELIKQSFSMIRENPLGVGLNNFTTELVKHNIPENITGFIAPVHNTFLIFFTELGIPGGIIFIVFILYIFFNNFIKNKHNLANFGVWVGILTFLINSQIHPLFNLDPTFDLIMLVLGYYSTCSPQKI